MFHLLSAGQGQCRSGVAVEQETGRLGQQLGIGCVTSVDRDIDLAPVDQRGETPDPPLLVGIGDDGLGGDAEVTQQDLHLIGRREAQRRTDDEVDDGGHTPAQSQAAENGDRQSRAVDHRGQGQQEDGRVDAPLQPPAEIGQSGDSHPDRHRHPLDREREVEARKRGIGGPPAGGPQQLAQDQAGDPRQQSGESDVPDRGPAPGEEGQRHRERDDADRGHPPDHRDQPPDPVRRRRHRGGHGVLRTGVGLHHHPAHEDGDCGHADAHGITPPPAGLPVADRGEGDGAPRSATPLGPRRMAAVGGGRKAARWDADWSVVTGSALR